MPDSLQDHGPDPSRKEVAHYLSDMATQLAAMAHQAGLQDVAAAFSETKASCDEALKKL